jgi:hypothetical protein
VFFLFASDVSPAAGIQTTRTHYVVQADILLRHVRKATGYADGPSFEH